MPPRIFLPLPGGGLIALLGAMPDAALTFIDATAPPIETPMALPPPEPDVGPRRGFNGDIPLSRPTVADPSTEDRDAGFFFMVAVLGIPAVFGTELYIWEGDE
jgi:hypothetical protein